MRFVSWNVNGLRAALKKGFMEAFKELDADAFCLQETKMQEGQAILDLPGYEQYFYSAEKKGYSGTAIFTRVKPLSVAYGIGIPEHDHEGRVITMEFDDVYLVTVYTPNAKRALERLEYRMTWEDAFRAFLLDPPQRGFYGRGARQVHGAARCGLCRYVPRALSRPHGGVYVVVVSAPCARDECGVAHRLLPRLRGAA